MPSSSLDWRELYAQNQAAIRSSGVALPSLPSPGPALGGLGRPANRVGVPLSGGGTGGALRAPSGEPHTFTVGGRARHALVYTPPGVGIETPAPLVCMLHGCTQDPRSFAAATQVTAAADRHGFVVLLPGQERGDNAMGCWNWFEPANQARGRGEPAAIVGIVGQMVGATAPRIDPRRVFVCGLSSGGAMASILAATYPDVFAAAAIHSGLAYGSASDLPSAYAAMANGAADPAGRGPAAYASMGRHARAIPTIVVHGTADRTVAPVNAHQVLRQTMTANRLAAPECRELDEHRPASVSDGHTNAGLAFTTTRWDDARGRLVHELLLVDGLGHAWSGGLPGGSYTDPRGPDATEAIARFFAEAVDG